MDDDRIREFETALWIGGEEVYRRSIDPNCLMVVPAAPFQLSGSEVIEAVANTPRWTSVEFDDLRIGRPQEGLIVLAYAVRAARDGEAYSAHCTSTYRRVEHERWLVVQHQQSIVPAAASRGEGSPEAAAGRAQGPERSDDLERAQQDAAQDRENEGGYQ